MLYRGYHPFYGSGGNNNDPSQLLYMLVSRPKSDFVLIFVN